MDELNEACEAHLNTFIVFIEAACSTINDRSDEFTL